MVGSMRMKNTDCSGNLKIEPYSKNRRGWGRGGNCLVMGSSPSETEVQVMHCIQLMDQVQVGTCTYFMKVDQLL